MSNIDESQKIACYSLDKKIKVIAPPGSGKTHTLIERIVFLIKETHVQPEKILAITFTNRAGQELECRLKKRLPQLVRLPLATTFHALALSLLREAFPECVPTLINEPERAILLKEIAHKFGIRVKELSRIITEAKSKYPISTGNELLAAYSQELACRNYIDFDDILINACDLLLQDQDFRLSLHERYSHIFVDEYQDISPIQIRFLQLICSPQSYLFVIGDPHQAIYSFRGGSPHSFQDFDTVFGTSECIELKTNYRSTQTIIQAAHSALKTTTPQPETPNQKGDLVQLLHFEDQKQEARWLIQTIRELLGGTSLTSYSTYAHHASEIGVIYRLNAIGTILEKYLSESDIPYQRVGTKSLFEYSDVQVILHKLKSAAITQKLSETLRRLVAENKGVSERLEHLVNYAIAYDSLPGEVAREKLLIAAQTSRDADTPRNENAISLLTSHAAKGLEFSVVFIIGAEDELFPYSKEGEESRLENIEEERRLFYVSMTRAKELLYLTHVDSRLLFGKTITPHTTRFLDSIPTHILQKTLIRKKEKEPIKQVSLF